VLPDEASEKVPLVPVDAVQTLGERQVVFVPGDTEGAFRPQPVELGSEAGGQVEIRKGLAPGAKVVIAGAFDLKAALAARRGGGAAHHH
jgi:multidrug efflux pump subunit AcrA (membrane-fusion protein)